MLCRLVLFLLPLAPSFCWGLFALLPHNIRRSDYKVKTILQSFFNYFCGVPHTFSLSLSCIFTPGTSP